MTVYIDVHGGIDCGGTIDFWKAMGEVEQLLGSRAPDFDELLSLSDSDGDMLSGEDQGKVQTQASDLLDEFGGRLGDHARWLLERLAGR